MTRAAGRNHNGVTGATFPPEVRTADARNRKARNDRAVAVAAIRRRVENRARLKTKKPTQPATTG
jgi:hypothetical protein